ncbi:hybrid sensor histidine kinase/response regulator [Labilibacter sediminis]|nr:hybrid sensor histidine kinase/response regulator [Labilibacter sediminis]
MNKDKILIVDDNASNIQILANNLAKAKYEVEYALDGESAVEWVESELFDAILLDVVMPGIDGFETCRQIKNDSKHKNTPIIFLTANDDLETVKKAFNAGGVDYLTKPYSQEELLARLATQIELNKNRQKLKNVNQYLEKQVEKKNKELKKAYEGLKVLDAAKNEFLSIISHELRTPLNGIIGSVSLLNNMKLEGDIQQVMAILNDSVSRLERYSLYAINISNTKLSKNAEKYFKAFKWGAVFSNAIQVFQRNNSVGVSYGVDFDRDDREVLGNEELVLLSVVALMEVSLSFGCLFKEQFLSYYKNGSVYFEISDAGTPNEVVIIDENSLSYSSNSHMKRSSFIELYFVNQVANIHKGELKFSTNNDGTKTTLMLPVN